MRCRPPGSRRFEPSGNDRLRPLSPTDKGRLCFEKGAAETCQAHNEIKKIIPGGASESDSKAAHENGVYGLPGLVPGIHVFAEYEQERRGWPGRSPAMTKTDSFSRGWKRKTLLNSSWWSRPHWPAAAPASSARHRARCADWWRRSGCSATVRRQEFHLGGAVRLRHQNPGRKLDLDAAVHDPKAATMSK